MEVDSKVQAAWNNRRKLHTKGLKLWDRSNKRGDKLRANNEKLRVEGAKLHAEGNIELLTAIIAAYGNVEIKKRNWVEGKEVSWLLGNGVLISDAE